MASPAAVLQDQLEAHMWGIELDRAGEAPLKRQVYEALRDRILCGRIGAGEALPSTRALSKALNVSRSTAVEAYEMLACEGYVLSSQGAPTRVADGLCVKRQEAPAPRIRTPKPEPKADFRTGQPDLSRFPLFLWRQCLGRAAEALPLKQYGYGGPEGLLGLRAEISAWLLRSRGLAADPDDIFITAGATHALHVLADLLCAGGKPVLFEDPCNGNMLETFLRKGCAVIPVPADGQGMRTDCLKGGTNAGAVYVTPSHQFPLGGILPAPRRAALIRFAQENDLYVVEDDYDSEFRYAGDPVAPLHAMDPQRVAYVGTFSKVLFPALRVGYAILPERLQTQWRALRTHTDVQNPPFEQAALAELLKARKLDRHLTKMRKLYGQRRQALLEAMGRHFGDVWAACGDAAGLHVAIDFPGMDFDEVFADACRQRGILVSPLERHCIAKGAHRAKLVLGYGHLEADRIDEAVRLLAEAIRELNPVYKATA
jgi:GntR family transcriptional regulator/MocR family aminotransferase